MEEVFILHHTYGNSENETYKLLGVFCSREQAQSAITTYLALPGFQDYSDGFSISRYIVGKLNWSEGFISDQTDKIE